METLELLSDVKSDYEAIISATDFTPHHLKWGSQADSTDRRTRRMEFIEEALSNPLVKQLVLKIAAEEAKETFKTLKHLYEEEVEVEI